MVKFSFFTLVLGSTLLGSPLATAQEALPGSVIGVEVGQCQHVRPDPETGIKLLYCCLDEIYAFQRAAADTTITPAERASLNGELRNFINRLHQIEALPTEQARTQFEGPYRSTIHDRYHWPTICGAQIPCERCRLGPNCGNGILEEGEDCDRGQENSDTLPDACRMDCTLPRCGDGIIDLDPGEQCDDGAENSNTLPNACRMNCKEPFCGDGIEDAANGESCDSGQDNSDTIPNRCRRSCQPAFCGDGVQDNGEACDDGNAIAGDGCNERCVVEEGDDIGRCGNGTVEGREQCDAGTCNPDRPEALCNKNIPDACRITCRLPACGDGITDSAEECDDGNGDGGDGCDALCHIERDFFLTHACGNGSIDVGEECDAGAERNRNAPDTCRFNCRFPVCGDLIQDTHEQCDDGNRIAGDGCDDACFLEFCGDGEIEGTEECDDGNLLAGDGCSEICTVEGGGRGTGIRFPSQGLPGGDLTGPLRPAAGEPIPDSSVRLPPLYADLAAPPTGTLTGSPQGSVPGSGASRTPPTGPEALLIMTAGSAAYMAWRRVRGRRRERR